MIRCVILLLCLLAQVPDQGGLHYPWLAGASDRDAFKNRIAPPAGYERERAAVGSFAAWLENIPLKQGNPPVRLYNGNNKWNQAAHCAVVNIDVGNKDLQQCADAVMRLRAEYLYSRGLIDSIGFHFTNGFWCDYAHWVQGDRPVVQGGNHVTWRRSADPGDTYPSFRKYLEMVFVYAGSYSLEKEMRRRDVTRIRAGDVFIQGGFPGHAVIVVDVCVNRRTGGRLFALAQSFMPAQDIHILKNPEDGTPWYTIPADRLITPEWSFSREDLRRF